MGTSSSSDKFSGRVAVLFGTRVLGAGIGIVYGILLARLPLGARRATARPVDAGSASSRQVFRYGLPFYPASLTGFFSYRIDAYLIAFLMTDAAEPLRFRSMAVGLAEMLFFLPNAISAVSFPHVASSSCEDANRQVPVASRVTLLVTGESTP